PQSDRNQGREGPDRIALHEGRRSASTRVLQDDGDERDGREDNLDSTRRSRRQRQEARGRWSRPGWQADEIHAAADQEARDQERNQGRQRLIEQLKRSTG